MEPRIIIHGGIESSDKRNTEDIERTLERICQASYELLMEKNAIDAVEYAISMMEDNPLFNAGTGAILQADGVQRMDASIMDGYSLKSGAVAQIQSVRNPIKVARMVMDKTPHRLIVGEEAQKFAYFNGVRPYAPLTRDSFERWIENKDKQTHYGTVGAVAIDDKGRIATGTSTGGWATSLPGRVGDVAIIGAGTYANNHAGISCTGEGEKILAVGLSRIVGLYMEEGYNLEQAIRKGIAKLNEINATVGFIAIDKNGNLARTIAQNNPYMPISFMPNQQAIYIP